MLCVLLVHMSSFNLKRYKLNHLFLTYHAEFQQFSSSGNTMIMWYNRAIIDTGRNIFQGTATKRQTNILIKIIPWSQFFTLCFQILSKSKIISMNSKRTLAGIIKQFLIVKQVSAFSCKYTRMFNIAVSERRTWRINSWNKSCATTYFPYEVHTIYNSTWSLRNIVLQLNSFENALEKIMRFYGLVARYVSFLTNWIILR